jgi:hypothetical protein
MRTIVLPCSETTGYVHVKVQPGIRETLDRARFLVMAMSAHITLQRVCSHVE